MLRVDIFICSISVHLAGHAKTRITSQFGMATNRAMPNGAYPLFGVDVTVGCTHRRRLRRRNRVLLVALFFGPICL